jgi:haloalkane dehalogenase
MTSPPDQPKIVPAPLSSPERDQRLETLGALYPFQSHGLDIGDVRMHYLDEGAGDPIVMLHGNPTWSFYYRDLVLGLRDKYRVIVPDHVGCGMSDKPQRYPYTLSTHIDNVARLIDHLGLDGVTLAVHDWGGAIGMGWAVRNLTKVARLIVFNTAAFLGGRIPFRIGICRWPLLGALAIRGLNGFARPATWMASAQHQRMTRDVRRGYLLPYDSWAHRIAVHRFVQDIPSSPKVPSYGVVEHLQLALAGLRDRPMIILWGMRDFCFTPLFLDEWMRRFPKAEVHRFEDAGHYVVEDAHERILPALLKFLA